MKTIYLFIFILLACISIALQAAADYPKPPLEAYGALPQISDAQISPDGTKVAAIVNFGEETRLVVYSLAGEAPVQIGMSNIKARRVEFFDNEHVIFHASETTTTFGFRGEYEFSGAFVLNLKTKKSNLLLKGTDGIFPAQSGLGRIIGRGENSGEVLMPAFMGSPRSDPSLDLLRVKLAHPKGRRYARGSSDTRDWFVGAGGKVLARERYNNRSNKYSVQAYQSPGWQTIFEKTDEIPMSISGITPDESGLVFVSRNNNGVEMLMKLGLDGEISGPLLPPLDKEIEKTYFDNNRKIVGVRYSGTDPDYAFLDDGLARSFESISAKLEYATLYLDSWTDDREVVLYRGYEPSLGDVWLIHRQSEDAVAMVAKRRPDIPVTALGALYSINYQARDDLTIQAILTLPPNFQPGESAPLPTIVLPHGGPAAYDRYGFDWMAQYFANRGYLVLQPNFRGSTGFGKAFEDAGRGEWGGKMQDDITDGVNALISAGYSDPDNICIAGVSYGGYAALAGAVFTPDLYKCVIAIAPVSDLNQMLRSEKRDHGRNHWVVSYWEDVMAEGDARREKLKSISPANFAQNVQAPVLLLHGNDDTVVPYAQSTRMKRALERADKQVELIKLKGEDHWLSVAETRMQTLREMDRFLREHMPIKDPDEPIADGSSN